VAGLARDEGIDLATAVLYDQLRNLLRNAGLIREVESDLSPPAGQTPRIVVVPGAFHVEHPHTGADGRRIRELAAELGWASECVAVPSLAPVAQNAQALTRLLAERSGAPTIIVSLSKGGADVAAALSASDAPARFRDVIGWVNLSGLVYGTPLIAWLRNHPLRCWGVRLLLRLRRQRFADIDELRHEPARVVEPPAHVRVIHVVGFPLSSHLSNDWARRGYPRLSPLGPNDGGGILLSDTLRLPGEVYPVWGADHYLNPKWDMRPLLVRLLVAASRGPSRRSASENSAAESVTR
jgi:hypothetical protein